LERKETDFQETLRLAAGLVLDVLAEDQTVVPGQEFDVTVSIINGGPYTYSGASIKFDLPPSWLVTPGPRQPEDGARGGRGGGARGAGAGATPGGAQAVGAQGGAQGGGGRGGSRGGRGGGVHLDAGFGA